MHRPTHYRPYSKPNLTSALQSMLLSQEGTRAAFDLACATTCSCVGLCWCFEGMDCSIVMSKTQPSSIIVPGFICESVVACWHNQHESLLHQRMWPTQPPDSASWICMWRTASSTPSLRCADRRRWLRAATQCRPPTTGKPHSTHPWRECPSPSRPSGEWLPWAEGLQAVSSN